ncbi:DUF3179 domain-containing (seleno)protein [Pelagibacterium halotolerans]|uniref:DUF3179 domain-containing (seleno)protein n=1 Tax=Pelagibacterium halotolerans TaxID=531813 RepID=UPI00384E969C
MFRPVSRVGDIGPNESVIQLEFDGIAHAYPLRVLTWHEIVNMGFERQESRTPISNTAPMMISCPIVSQTSPRPQR